MHTDLIGKDLRYGLIGSGSWATAIVKVLSDTGNKVNWYIRNSDNIDFIKEFGRNRSYLRSAALKIDMLEMSDDINEVVFNSNAVIFCVPSTYFLAQIKPLDNDLLKDKLIISATKGFVTNEHLTIAEYFHRVVGIPFDRIVVLSGPTHAEEVAMEKLSYLTFASKHIEVSGKVADSFSSHYVRVVCSTDIYGVEYSAAMKNVYAVAVGLCHSLGYGDNFISVLVTGAYNEMVRFLNSTHPDSSRIPSRSAYLGDLLVTCYSQFSRNRTFGGMIGKGYSVVSAHTEMNMVAEGYYATRCMYEISNKLNVELPIVNAMYQILYEEKSPHYVVNHLASILQ